MLYELNIGLNLGTSGIEIPTRMLKAALNELPYLLAPAVDIIATGYIPKGTNEEATLYVVFNSRYGDDAAEDLALHLAKELNQLAIPVRRADGAGFMVIPDKAAVPECWASFNAAFFQGSDAVSFYPTLVL